MNTNCLHFSKMQGIGNDYVYVNGFAEIVENKSQAAIYVSDRHFGIGSDGLIFINPSNVADFEMEMYNSDGSRAEMCGNGIRCVAKYVYDREMTDKTEFTIETLAGIKTVQITEFNHKAMEICVNMGRPVLKAVEIPIMSDNSEVLNEEILVAGKQYRMTGVSMGNPHVVIYMDSIEQLQIEKLGPLFECHDRFPRKINTEFVHVIDHKTVQMRVWERGAGETLACGTGACAVTVASILNGLTDREITVKLLGGELKINWNQKDGCVYMTGPAEFVFDGEIILP